MKTVPSKDPRESRATSDMGMEGLRTMGNGRKRFGWGKRQPT
jgi:hypothetical protein